MNAAITTEHGQFARIFVTEIPHLFHRRVKPIAPFLGRTRLNAASLKPAGLLWRTARTSARMLLCVVLLSFGSLFVDC